MTGIVLLLRLGGAVAIPAAMWSAIIAADVDIPLLDPWLLLINLAILFSVLSAGFSVLAPLVRRQLPLAALVYFPLMGVLLYFVGAEVSLRVLGKGP